MRWSLKRARGPCSQVESCLLTYRKDRSQVSERMILWGLGWSREAWVRRCEARRGWSAWQGFLGIFAPKSRVLGRNRAKNREKSATYVYSLDNGVYF